MAAGGYEPAATACPGLRFSREQLRLERFERPVITYFWELSMRSKLLLGVAASAIAALTLATTSVPASARWGGWGWGWGGAALAAGVVGGAAIAAATSPYWGSGYYGYGYPAYSYGYGYPGYSYGYGYPGYGYGYGGYGYGYGPTVSYGYGWDGAYASAGTARVIHRRAVRHAAR
jgi:hypothetical protein